MEYFSAGGEFLKGLSVALGTCCWREQGAEDKRRAASRKIIT
jgi:hypothetical protein